MPLPSTKSLLRRRAAALLLAVAVLPMAVAGCGGDDGGGSSDDATALIDKAFSTSMRSADLTMDAELKLDAPGAARAPIQLSAKGPFLTNKRKLPKLDLDITLGSKGQGQAIEGGILSTGDRVFVKFGGEYFEQPKARVDAANRDLQRQQRGGKPVVDPGAWVTDAKMEGEEKVAGVDTEHVTAKIDVRRMLKDLNEVARKGVSAAGGQAPQPLNQERLDQVAESLKNPSFDIYVGKDDDIIRRVSGNVAVSVPDGQRASGQISGGSLRFTMELADVNGDQKVEEPAKSRPISELSRQLGGAAALGALGGGQGGGSGSGSTTTPDAPATPGSGANDPDAIRRYIACINQTSPGDDAARERCRSELQ